MTKQELTISEKRTLFQILVLIMRADSILDPAETEYLDRIFHDFKLDISEFDHLEMIDFEYLSNVCSKFNADKMKYAKNLFVEMSKCDGYVHPLEKRIIDQL